MHNQGDVILVPLPFTDLTAQKKRPVLVLSGDEYNSTSDDLIVVAITSNIEAKPYVVLLTNNDMINGALTKDSCIRADKIYTISRNIVIKNFGKVKMDIIEKTKNRLFEAIKHTT
ncbi:MAG: type II toxin-antitoxin system PemK/MazF family toxin [Defluviitaleaceae bacterium]|nr:type II toxin-antitoxin system PemK/MazF family toxin [Defluviitaleaceae bacterium]